MFKKILTKLINWYVAPLEWNYTLGLYAKGRIFHFKEEHILSWVHFVRKNEKNVSEKEILIDAGVFKGGVSSIFAKHFPKNPIVGFEPIPKHFENSVKNTASFPNVKLLNMALSDSSGEQTFHIATTASASSLNPIVQNDRYTLAQEIQVKTVTLDDYFKEEDRILCLKMDIEGYELAVLKSGVKTLPRTRYVIAELNNQVEKENECQYYEVDEFLRQHGFKLIIIRAGYNYQGLGQYDAVYKNMNYKG
jgi:FkbM family methyltransferase